MKNVTEIVNSLYPNMVFTKSRNYHIGDTIPGNSDPNYSYVVNLFMTDYFNV